MTKVRIKHKGLPPFKANPGPGQRGAKERQQAFKENAEQALGVWRAQQGTNSTKGSEVFPWNPLSAKIELDIAYKRVNGANDAANIIGGISDALQGVFYGNDNQVKAIAYREPDSSGEDDDLLTVEVSDTDTETRHQTPKDKPTVVATDTASVADWEERLDRAWTARAIAKGGSFPGPAAAADAARVLSVSKLSASRFKTLQSLLDRSKLLKKKWARHQNTITRL